MKHLYKTKEGEILEANMIDYKNQEIRYLDDNYWIDLSDVQEVVLDKDGEPFMFEGEVVCVGDEVDGETVFDWQIFDNDTYVQMGSPKNTSETCLDSIVSHTPKHPQKKGVEKIDEKEYKATPIAEGMGILVGGRDVKIEKLAEKLNEVIDVVNKLKG